MELERRLFREVTLTFKFRSHAPGFVKRIVWDWKHRHTRVNPKGFPHELLECLGSLDSDSGVVDLGCGPGNLRAALRSRGWNGHYVGVDVSQEVIEVAKKSKDTNAEWHVSTIEEFPILSHKVSTICFCETIYYVKPEFVLRLLEQCRQSLVCGGRIVIRIWDTKQHRDYVAIVAGLGAQSDPPIYILSKE